jgi:hypothetical protein
MHATFPYTCLSAPYHPGPLDLEQLYCHLAYDICTGCRNKDFAFLKQRTSQTGTDFKGCVCGSHETCLQLDCRLRLKDGGECPALTRWCEVR